MTPATIARFEGAGDFASARLLRRIVRDEINHVRFGVRWFEEGCAAQRFDPHVHWKYLVSQHFRGGIKPPFNDSARATAGLTKDFYLGLAP